MKKTNKYQFIFKVTNKNKIYGGTYKKIFDIMNDGWYENAFQSDDSKIIDGYWYLNIEDEDYEAKFISEENMIKLQKIKNLTINKGK
jgi:hypothetical protein